MSREDLTTCHLRNALAGDTDALGDLVAHLAPLLLSQAAYRMGPVLKRHHDPEDLVNDAWLVTIPRLGSLPPRDGRHTPVLLQFLATTMLHRIQNLARKHIREVPQSRDSQQATNPLTQVSSLQSGIVTKAVRRENASAVHEALNRLDAVDREIVILRGIEQLPNQTVGVLVKMESKSVSKRYHRILERLRTLLPGSIFDELED